MDDAQNPLTSAYTDTHAWPHILNVATTQSLHVNKHTHTYSHTHSYVDGTQNLIYGHVYTLRHTSMPCILTRG